MYSSLLATLESSRKNVHPSWEPILSNLQPQIAKIHAFIAAEKHPITPPPAQIWRALHTPLHAVKVLIIGQDPYPTAGHANGLAFSTNRDVRPLPRSLRNIYTELSADLEIVPPEHGDLSHWEQQGVLLLNRVLTTAVGRAGSHQRKGWEEITANIAQAVAMRPQPGAAILWGRAAATLAPTLKNMPTLISAHPSPLSARRGFFGSRPFSNSNAQIRKQGLGVIDWDIP